MPEAATLNDIPEDGHGQHIMMEITSREKKAACYFYLAQSATRIG